MAGDESFNELTENLPESVNALFGAEDIASPVGYLDSQFFGYLGPLLLLIFAVSRGADAIAGEEQRHTFDLLMANPISRTRVVLHKFAAITVLTLALGAVCFLVMWALAGPVDMDIGAAELGAAMLGVSLLALLFAGIVLAISCMVSNKALSAWVTAGLATISYFVSSLAPRGRGPQPLREGDPVLPLRRIQSSGERVQPRPQRAVRSHHRTARRRRRMGLESSGPGRLTGAEIWLNFRLKAADELGGGARAMTFSYCHICNAEVVDFEGTCKQGHAFAPSPNKATPPPPPPKPAAQAPPPPPPPVRAEPTTVWKVLEQGGFQGNDPIAAFAPAPRMNWGPENEAPIVRSVRSLIDRTKSRRVERLETQALETQTAS